MSAISSDQSHALALDLLHDLYAEHGETFDPQPDDDADADDTGLHVPDDDSPAELLAAAVDHAQACLAEGTDAQPGLHALHSRALDGAERVQKAIRVPKGAEDVAETLRGFDGDALDGLRVEYHPDGPRYWIDQMDWHDGKAGKVVIAAAEKATGAKAQEGYKHKDGLPKGCGVYVFNEGPKPPGSGWVDLLRASRPELYKALRPGEKPTAAVDLDGTLARYDGWKGADHFGEPLAGAKDFLSELAKTHKVLIFTTRTKDDDPALMRGNAQNRHALAGLVRGWLDAAGMPYDDVYIGQGKPIADVYVDDRAIAVPPNPQPEDYAAALEAIRERTIQKAFDSTLHPRDDHGRFVSKTAIAAAKKDPAKAEKLRARVTDPAQRQKLDAALSGETHASKLGAAHETREAVTANRDEARAIRDRLSMQHRSGEQLSADSLHALIPHLSTMTAGELSNVRLMLSGAGASFGGTRIREDRVKALVAWARNAALESRMREHGFSDEEQADAKKVVGAEQPKAEPAPAPPETARLARRGADAKPTADEFAAASQPAPAEAPSPASRARAAVDDRAAPPVTALAKNPGGDRNHVAAAAKLAPDEVTRDYLEAALHNMRPATADLSPQDRRRQTVDRLAAVWRDALADGHPETAAHVQRVFRSLGAETHGPAAGEEGSFDGRYYESATPAFPGDRVRVTRQPVVMWDKDGAVYIAVKGTTEPVR